MGDILIVDDEKDIRELVGDILRDDGHSARLAWDADSTLKELNQEPPDLIILDIWLKDSRMDGIDILKKVKLDNPGIPVVIISGHGNIEIAVAAVKQGAYDFIEKPFNIDQLLVVVNRAMEASRLRRENASLRVKDVTATKMIGTSAAFKTLKARRPRFCGFWSIRTSPVWVARTRFAWMCGLFLLPRKICLLRLKRGVSARTSFTG